MISVNMDSLWSCETKLIIKGIKEATENIIYYAHCNNHSQNLLLELGNDIYDICNVWTGKTYVGCEKTKELQDAFQKFFTALMYLLLKMKNSPRDYEVRVAKAMLYTGTVYRYLGKNEPNKIKVVPVYNNIYVSWSKLPTNHYFLSKLYGPVTWMACNIVEPQYGIDLEVIGCSRANEREVVFPTIESCITEIKYIMEDER